MKGSAEIGWRGPQGGPQRTPTPQEGNQLAPEGTTEPVKRFTAGMHRATRWVY